MRGILTSSWCEAREEVGPDATQKRQLIGQIGQKLPRDRIHSFRIQIACSNFNFWGPLGQVAISISKKYTCRWVLPKVEKPILRWDPGGAQKKWSKCPRLERPILRWDLGGAKLITALNFMLLHHVFHRNVQLYFQRRGCSNQAVYNGFRIRICSFPYLNLILPARLEHPCH